MLSKFKEFLGLACLVIILITSADEAGAFGEAADEEP
jgi:hypothetical protein